ncbi:MAG: DUF4390 domain-containing protein [Rhodocyclaceae bacterium]|jgi:hypothetical protein|nr:DUF4390 domain-containing protein [Rhodocyclaceae bacterium]MCA4904427.1 DUF4390 domain-containing protein [Rhodocyclaceae bacterium]
MVAMAAVLLLALSSSVARADGIVARNASLEASDDGWLLSTDFQITLSAPVEEALSKGITLFFVLELEVSRGRWYWFDQRAGVSAQTYRLGYNTLTRQYRLAAGTLFQNFATLEEALAVLGRVRRRPVLPLAALARGNTYAAAVRMRLDLSQLPRPFQASPFATREWTLTSDWYRFAVTP